MNLSTKSAFGSFCLAIIGCGSSALAVTAAQDLKLTFTDTALGGYTMPYNLFLPAGYDPAGPALPVILYLHGAGERGSNNTSQINASMQPLIDATQSATGSQRAIVIAPQCPLGQVWNSINTGDNWTPGGTGISSYAETATQQNSRSISNALRAALDILDHVQATQAVNSQKLYITGMSMGGFGTWDAITRYPGKFAAAMPLSGGGNRLAGHILANEPIWDYHGVSDTTVYPNGSTDVINAIRAAGGSQSICTLQGGTGHAGWNVFYTPYSATPVGGAASFSYYVGSPATTGGTPAYAGDTVYEWLFAQTAVPEPTSVTLFVVGSAGWLCRRRRTAKSIGSRQSHPLAPTA